MKNLPLVAVRDNNKRHIEILKTNIPTAVPLQMCNLKTRSAGNFRILSCFENKYIFIYLNIKY